MLHAQGFRNKIMNANVHRKVLFINDCILQFKGLPSTLKENLANCEVDRSEKQLHFFFVLIELAFLFAIDVALIH